MHIEGSPLVRRLSLLAGTALLASNLCAVVAVAATSAEQGAAAKSNDSNSLEEVIVTAAKREERLLDAPQSVSVLTGSSLAAMGATKFSDWASSVPGVTFTTQGAGFSKITLRGITVGNDIGSTTATYVDEVPFGASTNGVHSWNYALDPGLFDIDRVEVLRGPQGTLYGASTLGGLVKYVSVLPDSTKSSGRAQVGVSGNEYGGLSYNGSAAVNLPLVSGLAGLRASAFYSHDGGYVDNVTLGEKNANRSGMYGGRFDLLLTPANGLSIRLNYFAQNIARDGQATADYDIAGSKPVAGTYDQLRKVREVFDQQFRIASATINYDFGLATLTSISSYQTQNTQEVADASGAYAPFCAFVGASCAGAYVPATLSLDKFTQELRLTSNSKGPVEWTLGAYYNRETSAPTVGIHGIDAAGQPVISLLDETLPALYEERAAFGDVTYHFTKKFDVTAGIRYFKDHQTLAQNPSTGAFGGVIGTRYSDENSNTYLANARYHFSDDDTLYLRYATGYRPGGPTIFSSIGPPPAGTPSSYQPDKLKSSEVGYKVQLFDRRLVFDASAYHITWSGIHDTAPINGFVIVVNSGDAIINGAELSLAAQATHDLTISGALTFNDAWLKSANPNLGGHAGERLPDVPRVNATLGADYAIPVGDWSPTIGASVQRVTDRYASFLSSGGYYLPAYTKVDLRAGCKIRDVKLDFYVHNLTNEVIQQSADGSYSAPGTVKVSFLDPRTFGVNASVAF